ncbi:glycoside hydrolase superfamily [Halteromyces radiatus]|uniref:glycoside hydrolase superfamily n=1 Tax=Halteromyces radiatus TaxID=101107 RepID=UPI00221FBB0F|nr:glycoside hydrolase superfamily [Halteromyces radiatus]KAI8079810.1 glycoside hydrolase superfamily [Halteromyces radiatus]
MIIHFIYFLILMISSVICKDTFGSHRLTAYVTDWAFPTSIPWHKLDHVIYAFAVPDQYGRLGQFNGDQLQQLVTQAHAHHKGCSLSIGGWTGSVYFSSLIRTPTSRERFANNLIHLVQQYKLNGINLDWEYPNADNGVSCNQAHPYDTENFLTFVQLLRKKLDSVSSDEHKVITAAVASKAFNGRDKQPLRRLDKGWSVVDAFYVMAYDLRGNWDTVTGANAPLKGPGTTVKSAIKDWMSAGIPRNKLVVGVPFYGYVTRTNPKARYTTSMAIPLVPNSAQIRGDNYDTPEVEPCRGASKGVYSGEYQWRSIQRDGILHNQGGWHSVWDRTTQTPYSVNRASNKFLTFDDPKSLRSKAEFVDDYDLAGIMIWSLEMDDSQNSLLNSLQSVRDD